MLGSYYRQCIYYRTEQKGETMKLYELTDDEYFAFTDKYTAVLKDKGYTAFEISEIFATVNTMTVNQAADAIEKF